MLTAIYIVSIGSLAISLGYAVLALIGRAGVFGSRREVREFERLYVWPGGSEIAGGGVPPPAGSQ